MAAFLRNPSGRPVAAIAFPVLTLSASFRPAVILSLLRELDLARPRIWSTGDWANQQASSTTITDRFHRDFFMVGSSILQAGMGCGPDVPSSDSITSMPVQSFVRPAKFVCLIVCVAAATLSYGIQAGRGPHARAAARVSIVSWQPAQLVNGSPCLLQLRPGVELKSLTGTWMGHTVFFDLDPSRTTWLGFAGVAAETEAGTYTLALQGVTPQATPFYTKEPVRGAKAAYPRITLRPPR